jgi:hypothetical protein
MVDAHIRGPRPARWLSSYRVVWDGENRPLIDHRRYPLSRVVLVCGACAWARDYDPERVIEGLRTLRWGTASTVIKDVAGRVRAPCPHCRKTEWTTILAWPPGIDPAEIKRAANRYRN